MFYTPALLSVYCSHLLWLLLGIALQAWRDLSSEPEKQLLHYALTVTFYSNKAPILAESSKQQCLAASPDYPPKFSVVPKAPIQCPPWSSQVLNILCAWMHEEKGRKKEGKQSVKKQWLSLVWAERECWSRRETSSISQAGEFRKYSCRRLIVVMIIEQSSSKRQQRSKTEALCRAENIVSHQHWAMKTAGTEQLSSFPLPDPSRVCRNKWPGMGFTLETVFKIFLLSVNLQIVAFFQQRTDY